MYGRQPVLSGNILGSHPSQTKVNSRVFVTLYTATSADYCKDRMVRHVGFHGTFPLSTQTRLQLLETLFLNLSACNIMDDLGELDALLGLDDPGELRGPEFLETLLAPLLESAVNLKRLSLAGIRDLESFPILSNALVASFARTRSLSLIGRSLIELLGRALQLENATIPLSRLFLQLMPNEDWMDIWRLLEPCRTTLVFLGIYIMYRCPVPPLESCRPWPLMSELSILSDLLPVTKIFSTRVLRKAFPNLQHLRIASGAVSAVDVAPVEAVPEDQVDEDEDEEEVVDPEWRTLQSFSGHAITFAALGFNCQLSELTLRSDCRSITAPSYPNTARHLCAAMQLAQPRCFSLEVFDVCTPLDEDLEDAICQPLLWESAPHLEYIHLSIMEGPCCNQMYEFLDRFCGSLRAARVSYLVLSLSTCRNRSGFRYGEESDRRMIGPAKLLRDVATCVRRCCSKGLPTLNYVEIKVWDRTENQFYRYLYGIRRHIRDMGEAAGDRRVEFVSLDSAVAPIVKRSLGVKVDII
ncbi:hypothetical protein GLOTRDRAFT_94321 [Gloeophyllum trabeum ATCC 11539]|uniref:F-box domain-containing protein n=1 Tax=Gloeophyllum trabeum (strain ATCC 11539 / FP-39264 / Madison 617) TaxID=670483 RepID=S7RMH6_GLOTA|nr:uncharacterized protein GLOTRDRAFT_94321 [Gloeophyllum trabeum ATCC 11539]EPQ53894.1 hypothetical protein GLOTRDRAFT_94321 [Gloeophyllum trabeum ATCC 11539]